MAPQSNYVILLGYFSMTWFEGTLLHHRQRYEHPYDEKYSIKLEPPPCTGGGNGVRVNTNIRCNRISQ